MELTLFSLTYVDPSTVSTLFIAILIGGIIGGIMVGAVPAICGAIKRKPGLAVGGFFACFGANILLGLLLSAPLCVLFTILIFRKGKDETSTPAADSAPVGASEDTPQ